MPPIVPATIAECRVVGELHGQACINVWHMASSEQFVDFDTWGPALLALAAAMAECAFEKLLPAVTSDYRLVRTEAKMIYPVVTDYFIDTSNTNAVGALGPTSVSFTSSLVNLRSGRDGKRGRGKKFLPPPGEANVANSILDDGTLELIAEYLLCVANKFIGSGATQPWRLGVLSRKDFAGNVANFPTAFKELVQMTPVAQVAKMGSRKVGRGA